ncbi:hypothetical protein [Hydrogenimonas cancrithermarum]|uniref:Lipoprotein n=1 Tax=Hydrogenimonas cancrithermarum TaxID=2993563 RepID=A0ABM8FJ18_9BACT|nr:hypothetical protein [Hydrogenimonas cancrithermarum]BDY12281.1 lipoprotein [Hydrogenimonas cancrithermarum]
MIRSSVFSFLLLLFALLGTGCSEKNYFEPETIEGVVNYDGELPAKIVEIGYDSATLANGQVITEEGLLSYHLPKGYRYIAQSGPLVAAAGDCKPNIIFNTETNSSDTIDLPRRLLAALFIPGTDAIAFLIEGNSYGIYDYKAKKTIVKYGSDPALTADIRIASPMMLEQLVLIPTLDGKLVILNKNNGAKVREIVVGKGEEFNNIIFLDVIGNRLVAATPHRIISVSPKLMDAQTLEISHVLFLEDGIYILSKEGTIYHCDTDLKILQSRKFPFAHFVGAIYGEFIYLIEKQGYIIATDPVLASENVFEIPDEIDDWFFATKDTLYYEKYYFKLHQ